MSDRLATAHIIKTMHQLYYRYFCHNLTIRRCSPTLQLQLLHGNVLGPVVYLLSVLSVDNPTQTKFDTRVRHYVRQIFGLPRGTPNSIVTAIGRINPFTALQGRERARLHMQTPIHSTVPSPSHSLSSIGSAPNALGDAYRTAISQPATRRKWPNLSY